MRIYEIPFHSFLWMLGFPITNWNVDVHCVSLLSPLSPVRADTWTIICSLTRRLEKEEEAVLASEQLPRLKLIIHTDHNWEHTDISQTRNKPL